METANSTTRNYKFSAKCDAKIAIEFTNDFIYSGDTDYLKQAKAYIERALKTLEEEENNAG